MHVNFQPIRGQTNISKPCSFADNLLIGSQKHNESPSWTAKSLVRQVFGKSKLQDTVSGKQLFEFLGIEMHYHFVCEHVLSGCYRLGTLVYTQSFQVDTKVIALRRMIIIGRKQISQCIL